MEINSYRQEIDEFFEKNKNREDYDKITPFQQKKIENTSHSILESKNYRQKLEIEFQKILKLDEEYELKVDNDENLADPEYENKLQNEYDRVKFLINEYEEYIQDKNASQYYSKLK